MVSRQCARVCSSSLAREPKQFTLDLSGLQLTFESAKSRNIALCAVVSSCSKEDGHQGGPRTFVRWYPPAMG